MGESRLLGSRGTAGKGAGEGSYPAVAWSFNWGCVWGWECLSLSLFPLALNLLVRPPHSQLTRSETGVLVSTASSLFVGRGMAAEDDTVSLRSCL